MVRDERQILLDALTEAEQNLIGARLAVDAADWARAGRALFVAAAYCREANQSATRLLAEEWEKEKQR